MTTTNGAAPGYVPAVTDPAASGPRHVEQPVAYDAIVLAGFVSDHMEVLWDLDTEAVESCAEAGLAVVRTPTPGTHPAYVAGLVDLVMERVNGASASERPACTELGPWFDVCRPGCCENIRAGFQPAIAGVAA